MTKLKNKEGFALMTLLAGATTMALLMMSFVRWVNSVTQVNRQISNASSFEDDLNVLRSLLHSKVQCSCNVQAALTEASYTEPELRHRSFSFDEFKLYGQGEECPTSHETVVRRKIEIGKFIRESDSRYYARLMVSDTSKPVLGGKRLSKEFLLSLQTETTNGRVTITGCTGDDSTPTLKSEKGQTVLSHPSCYISPGGQSSSRRDNITVSITPLIVLCSPRDDSQNSGNFVYSTCGCQCGIENASEKKIWVLTYLSNGCGYRGGISCPCAYTVIGR